MIYVVSFDGCGVENPLQSKSPEIAVDLGRAAERKGCQNVVIMAPGAGILTIDDFARQYCTPKRTDAMAKGPTGE